MTIMTHWVKIDLETSVYIGTYIDSIYKIYRIMNSMPQ